MKADLLGKHALALGPRREAYVSRRFFVSEDEWPPGIARRLDAHLLNGGPFTHFRGGRR
jgi:hypothetical protein